MAFCEKCGTQVGGGVRFCPSCGAPVGEAGGQAPYTGQQGGSTTTMQSVGSTTGNAADFDGQDIQSNKGMAVLSYLGPLVLVPILAAPKSRYARFHANQGLVLMIADIAYGIVQSILLAILAAIFPWNWSYGYWGGRGAVYGVFSTILSLVWILFTVLSILGIINAATGKVKELPVIGKIRILK